MAEKPLTEDYKISLFLPFLSGGGFQMFTYTETNKQLKPHKPKLSETNKSSALHENVYSISNRIAKNLLEWRVLDQIT